VSLDVWQCCLHVGKSVRCAWGGWCVEEGKVAKD